MVDSEAYAIKVNEAIERERLYDPFENKKLTKVFFATPSNGQVDAICYDNLKDFIFELSEVQHHSKFKFFSATTGRMLVTFARETIAEKALELGMDWILFVDDDQILPKKMFIALARHMDKADLIAPIVFQRVHPYKPVVYKVDVNKDEKTGMIYTGTDHRIDYPINSEFEADAVGFGVVLLRTEILKKIPKPWFFSNTNLGEDIYFCVRAKQHGFKILVDSRVKVGHLGIPEPRTELDFILNNKDLLKTIHKDKLDMLNNGVSTDIKYKEAVKDVVKETTTKTTEQKQQQLLSMGLKTTTETTETEAVNNNKDLART